MSGHDSLHKVPRRILRKMDFLSDQKGIMNRFLRESENWEKHLHETQRFILQTAKTKEKNLAVILGSGWLLDVPIEALTQQFRKVHLYDIIHPPQIKKKMEKYPNVKLFEADLTGGAIQGAYEAFTQYKRKMEKKLINSFGQYRFHFPYKPDFVVSCNVLTQLSTLVVSFLRKKKVYTDKELNRLEHILQEQHIQFLYQQPSVIISEYKEILRDPNDQFIGSNPLLHTSLPEARATKTWEWKFDTEMRYREDMKTIFHVKAIDLK